MLQATQSYSPSVDSARLTVWRLWEEGYLDENEATARLLSLDLERRHGVPGRSPTRLAPYEWEQTKLVRRSAA